MWIAHRVFALPHHQTGQVLLGHAVAVHISRCHHGHCRDGLQRHVLFIERIEDLVEHFLGVGCFGNSLGTHNHHRAVHTGADQRIRRLYHRSSRGTAGMNTQHRFAGAENMVDAPAVGIRYPHEGGGRERENDRIDVIGLHVCGCQAPDGRLLRLFRISQAPVAQLEVRLVSAKDTDYFSQDHLQPTRKS